MWASSCATWRALWAIAAASLAWSETAAIDRLWIGSTGLPPGDGTSFADPLNWLPNGVPGAADAAIFNGVGGDLLFTSAFTNIRRMRLGGATPLVRLDLASNVLLLNATDPLGLDRSLILGASAGDAVSLQINSGVLILDHSGVGAAPGSAAIMEATGGATVIALGEGVIGEDGDGSLSVLQASSLIHAGDALLARHPGSSASVLIADPGSSWVIVGDLHVGGSGDGPGGNAVITINQASVSADSVLVLHPGAAITLTDATLHAGSASLDSALLTLDATSRAVISDGVSLPVAGLVVGGSGSGSLTLGNGSKVVAPLVAIDAPSGAEALVSLDASRVESDQVVVSGAAVIQAVLADGSPLPGEEAIFAVSGAAAFGGLLALSNSTPPLAPGESIRLAEAASISSDFSVVTAPLIGGFNFIAVSKTPLGSGVELRADMATLDARLNILPPTNDPLPGVPNLVTVATFGADRSLVDAAVTIPGPTRRAPATVVIARNTLPAPGEQPGFEELATVTVDGDPAGLAQGKLSPSGRNDIVVSSGSAGTVTIIRNEAGPLAGPSFEVSQVITIGGSAGGLAVADLDGENGPDIVVAEALSGSFVVLLNDGRGFFAVASTVPAGTGTQGVSPLDLDQDKDIDVVAMNTGIPEDPASSTVTVHKNLLAESKGRFVGFAPGVSYQVGPLPVALVCDDLNGDGAPEIITANAGDGTISILVNDGQGGFAPAVNLSAGGTPKAGATVDNGTTGYRDLAVLVEDDLGAVSLTVFRNDTVDGILTLVPIFNAQTLYGLPAALGSGNADSDGPADLVTAGAAPDGVAGGIGAISVLLARPLQCPGAIDGDGFVDGSDLGALLGAWGPNPGSPADLNGDGVVDGSDLGILLASWGPCP